MTEKKKRIYIFIIRNAVPNPSNIREGLLADGFLEEELRNRKVSEKDVHSWNFEWWNLVKFKGIIWMQEVHATGSIPVKIIKGEIKKGEKITLQRIEGVYFQDIAKGKPKGN